MFKVSARTILELGAELISSDAVAIYELVKNAIDARSTTGVRIEMSISIRHSHYVDVLAKIEHAIAQAKTEKWSAETRGRVLADLRNAAMSHLQPTAPQSTLRTIRASLDKADDLASLRDSLVDAYKKHNWIEFRDTGTGMSTEDLLKSYLVIGTPSRRYSLETDLKRGTGKPTYLGEKGVGRLSVMRLGSYLSITTATVNDKYLNTLEIDWTAFEDLTKMVEDIDIVPGRGAKKVPADYSGTVIRVSDLRASWSMTGILEVATWELARLTDPFTKTKRRLRIEIVFNGERVEIPRLEHSLLGLAQASAIGSYSITDGKPTLAVDFSCGDLGKGNPPEKLRLFLEKVDLRSITAEADSEIAASALTSVGPFGFELYWFNRQRVKKVDTIGDRKQILALIHQWGGVMLFRDGYRVNPYGNDDDDWLGLDRRALASPGYKLNKQQFLGRVTISRTGNANLVDQTNREGLKDCDEKAVLLETLQFVIQNRMRRFLDDVEKRHQATLLPENMVDGERRVRTLRTRALSSIQSLEKRHSEELPVLNQLTSIIEEMNEYFLQAKQKAEQVEDERDRMIQLAGIGLMLEIVAHELARSTEHTIDILNAAPDGTVSAELSALFSSLRDEMTTMNKRLRVLDPLSISGRQRKETFEMGDLVKEIFAAHTAQFKRHEVKTSIRYAGEAKTLKVTGVRGMFVQIVENLIQNSIYWMKLKKLDEEDYKPKITVVIGERPTIFEFTDNGPGIHSSLQDEVFKAFFSTKGKSKRQGLGLFIASDCAQHNGLSLSLSPESREAPGRLNTFVLEEQEAK
jgi:signal transduction histidine kinase